MSAPLDQQAAVEQIKLHLGAAAAERPKVVLFIGAGRSLAPPACCPLWNMLMHELLLAGACAHDALKPLAESALHAAENGSEPIKPETTCQILHSNLGVGALGFLDLLAVGSPNVDHFYIAALAKQGAVPLIITTNFDTLIEDALTATRVPLQMRVRNLDRWPAKKKPVTVFKPHGCLTDPAAIIMTARHAGRALPTRTANSLRAALDDAVLLIDGYSGNDDDLFPELMRGARHVRAAYWFYHGEPNERQMSFGGASQQCRLVAPDKSSIFAALAGMPSVTSTESPPSKFLTPSQAVRLRSWAGRFSKTAWVNFYTEILLNTSSDAGAHLALQWLTTEDSQEKRALVVTRRLRLRGHARSRIGQWDVAADTLAKAALAYRRLARPREFIETVALLADVAPDRMTVAGCDLVNESSWLAGKTYQSYELALSSYIAGRHCAFDGKQAVARKFLTIAAGLAQRCGDLRCFVRCLAALLDLTAEPAEAQWRGQLQRALLRFDRPFGAARGSWRHYGPYRKAANRFLSSLVRGEIVIFLVLTVLAAIVAAWVADTTTEAILYVAVSLPAYIGPKIWNLLKERRAAPLDRE
jgi:hypothetical protein